MYLFIYLKKESTVATQMLSPNCKYLKSPVNLTPEQCMLQPFGSWLELQLVDMPIWRCPVLQDAVRGLGAAKLLAAVIGILTGRGTAV